LCRTDHGFTWPYLSELDRARVPNVGLYQEGVSVALSSKFTVPGYASSPPLNEQDDYAPAANVSGHGISKSSYGKIGRLAEDEFRAPTAPTA